jgi:hypothetical protein
MNLNSEFQPGQIVGLDCQSTCLYAEVIQVVTQRQMCWVRPLMLVEKDQPCEERSLSQMVSDLRQSSDLILPLSLFRVALDTEVIPLLMQLNINQDKAPIPTVAHQHLQAFIRRVWQVAPQAFRTLRDHLPEGNPN